MLEIMIGHKNEDYFQSTWDLPAAQLMIVSVSFASGEGNHSQTLIRQQTALYTNFIILK